MLNIGIIGMGSMGSTHFSAYSKLPEARVVAVADTRFSDPNATVGRSGNMKGQSGSANLEGVKKYADYMDLLNDPEVHAIDICTPSMLHKDIALAVIGSGKPLLVEKPLARTAADAREIVEAAAKAGVFLMPAHCMRFWPGWDWLKNAVAEKTYGEVESIYFTRIGAKPESPLYNDAAAVGGAHLDFHIHDTDFVLHLFGMPAAVSSFGRVGESGAVEHTLTRYCHEGSKALVVARGEWNRASEKRPFIMRYEVVFEEASAVFNLGDNPALVLYRKGQAPQAVEIPDYLGYDGEIAEFVRCVTEKRKSGLIDARDGYRALEIIEAELESIEKSQTVHLKNKE